jgi:hypothetical protein
MRWRQRWPSAFALAALAVVGCGDGQNLPETATPPATPFPIAVGQCFDTQGEAPFVEIVECEAGGRYRVITSYLMDVPGASCPDVPGLMGTTTGDNPRVMLCVVPNEFAGP